MTKLNESAKAALREAGITQADWARTSAGQLPDGTCTAAEWTGDACGCPDDRCIGYHHDGPDDCGCLPVLLEQYLARRRHPDASSEATR